MATLLNTLQARTTNQLPRMADTLAEPQSAVSTALTAAFASLLSALLKKTTDADTMNPIMDLLTDRVPPPPVLPNPDPLLSNDPHAAAISDRGGMFLSIMCGTQLVDVTAALSEHAAIKRESASRLLAVAAGLIVNVVGDRVRKGSMSAKGLARALNEERETILAATPPALLKILGIGSLRTDNPALTPPSSLQSAWPMVAALVLLLVARYVMPRGQVPQLGVPAATESRSGTGAAGEAHEKSDGPSGPDAVVQQGPEGPADVGAFVTRKLPSNVELSIPASGTEMLVITFIEDAQRPTEPPVWFTFDRVGFETGSTNLKQESARELKNIAEILKAYPYVHVKIGAYTDNTGYPAANLQLSQARAAKVADAIVEFGISPERVTAEGYGDQNPLADSSTDEGRARNRRITIRVTQK